MRTPDKHTKKRTAVIIMSNEVVLSALGNVARDLGYDVCQNIGACGDAAVAFIDSYFTLLGVPRHVRELCPALPFVLVQNSDYLLDGDAESYRDFYDVIALDSNRGADIEQKVRRWFSEKPGKLLVEGG